ncbi:MAG: acyl-CoA thioesterase, partial [Rhodothermales bacterium]|nr:acyl-CoA thioesterase [Rhodothermales bacterium]
MAGHAHTSSSDTIQTRIYEHRVVVGTDAVDGNDHVNNVEYVRWMQDAATAHSDAVGCTAATIAAGATWMVRAHHVEYLRPSFKNETLTVRTWISNAHRVR